MLRILKDKSYFTTQGFHIKVLFVNILSIIINAATGSFYQSVQMLNQGGFTGTGMSDDTDKFSIFYFQINIL